MQTIYAAIVEQGFTFFGVWPASIAALQNSAPYDQPSYFNCQQKEYIRFDIPHLYRYLVPFLDYRLLFAVLFGFRTSLSFKALIFCLKMFVLNNIKG